MGFQVESVNRPDDFVNPLGLAEQAGGVGTGLAVDRDTSALGDKAEDVVRVMERMKLTRGVVSRRIKVDNGSEFISKALDKWAYENNVALDFSRPGKPTDNAFIESFNGSFRDECLNVNWFLSIDDAKEKIKAL